jgi:hypothetical protein
MEKTKLNRIHDIINCMNDIGMLDSYWEESMRVDILESLDYRIRSKSDDLDTARKVVKLNNLLKSIENIRN